MAWVICLAADHQQCDIVASRSASDQRLHHRGAGHLRGLRRRRVAYPRWFLKALAVRRAAFPFAHGAVHQLPGGLRLFDSYHCSRYNTNTGMLTPKMFRAVFAKARAYLERAA